MRGNVELNNKIIILNDRSDDDAATLIYKKI